MPKPAPQTNATTAPTTPARANVAASTTPSRKTSAPPSVTPTSSAKRTRRKSSPVTETSESDAVDAPFVPKYIFRTVDYLLPSTVADEGDNRRAHPLHGNKLKVCALIRKHYVIPSDFDMDLRKFGAHSGLLHEDRLISAYECSLLERKASAPAATTCYRCLKTGHKSYECPTLLEPELKA